MLYIRTDANPTIATGHVMRCISIAKEVVKLGEEVTFITADMQAKEIIKSNGFSIISLHSAWSNLDSEIESFIQLIKARNIEKILVDSYYVTEIYLSRLRDYARIFYLDDLAMFPYPVDVVINYNNYAKDLNYSMDKTEYVLGCQYAPLREEFRNIKPTLRKSVQRVLITTGGSDSYHVAVEFIKYIEQKYLIQESQYLKTEHASGIIFLNSDRFRLDDKANIINNLEFHVIVGKFNTDQENLNYLSNKYPQIILHNNITNMSEIMKNCDIAVTAGGSTMYELCACGVPMITYAFADNQLLGVKGFEKLGVAHYCGDIRQGELVLWNAIENSIIEYSTNTEHRLQVARKMHNLVDGNGAIRLAKLIYLSSRYL